MWRYYKAFEIVPNTKVKILVRHFTGTIADPVFTLDSEGEIMEYQYEYRRRQGQSLADFISMVKAEVRAHILRLRAEEAQVLNDVSNAFDPGDD